jgi:hypothetical protein
LLTEHLDREKADAIKGDNNDESNELIADYVSTPTRRGSVNTSNGNCSNYIMSDVQIQSLVGETLTLTGYLEPLWDDIHA